eukprot:7477468-Heterocapsa_arctica.AAC.1
MAEGLRSVTCYSWNFKHLRFGNSQTNSRVKQLGKQNDRSENYNNIDQRENSDRGDYEKGSEDEVGVLKNYLRRDHGRHEQINNRRIIKEQYGG